MRGMSTITTTDHGPRTPPAQQEARRAAALVREELQVAFLAGAERLLLTLDPSEPGSSAVLEELRRAVGRDRVVTRPAGASVLVDVDLDAA